MEILETCMLPVIVARFLVLHALFDYEIIVYSLKCQFSFFFKKNNNHFNEKIRTINN